MPFAPDFGRGEHAAGTTLVAKSCLTGTVGSSTGHTRDTGDGATYLDDLISNLMLPVGVWSHEDAYRYPTIRPTFGVQLSRSLHMAVSCSLPCQYGHSYSRLSFTVGAALIQDLKAYCTMSGRIGDRKTAGRGCVDPLGVPSAPAMVTVGRTLMLALLTEAWC